MWGNALRRLPAAFLWLSRVSVRKDTSLYAQGNLLNEAAAAGVRSERLAFSFKFPQNDYVAFRALADLMVDTIRIHTHTHINMVDITRNARRSRLPSPRRAPCAHPARL